MCMKIYLKLSGFSGKFHWKIDQLKFFDIFQNIFSLTQNVMAKILIQDFF